MHHLANPYTISIKYNTIFIVLLIFTANQNKLTLELQVQQILFKFLTIILLQLLLWMEEGLLDINKIPRLEFEIHNEELKACIRELYSQSKAQEKNQLKIKKDIECRPTDNTLAQSLLLINANIQIDGEFLKIIAKREHKKQEENLIKNASYTLGAKIGQISDCLKYILDKINALDKKISTNQSGLKAMVNEKCSSLQSQLEESKKNQNKENRTFGQNMQLNLNKYEEKVREVESKTLWQINDCQAKLNDRVNEQFVRDNLKEAEGKIMNKVREGLIKNNIDPERIDLLQSNLMKVEKDCMMKIVESNSKLANLSEHLEKAFTHELEFNEEKIENEKKIGQMQVFIAECNRKVKSFELENKQFREERNKMNESIESINKQVIKMGRTLSNLKLSDDFQKFMEKLDPHKICEIDNTLKELSNKDVKLQRELDSVKKFVEKLREKTEICNLLTPSSGPQASTSSKEEINKLFNDFMLINPQIKKIQMIQLQLGEIKNFTEMINEINKRISRLQKQFDIQSVIYSVKGLEEYIKKQLSLLSNRVSLIEGTLNAEKNKRPLSASRRTTSDGKMGSSISYKKLVPVDCISCYQNPMTNEKMVFGKKY